MGYFGTILLARSDRLLTDLPGLDAFGYRHRRLRELGRGWQVLETQSFDDPPDLVEAARLRPRSWGIPLPRGLASETGGDLRPQP